MLSKFVTSLALKKSAARLAPQMMNRQMVFVSQRGFLDRLGLESHATDIAVDTKGAQVSLWEEKANKQEHSLILKDNDQISKYVLSIVKNYFRTTKKAKVALDTPFRDHGLDSLDIIELVI